MKQVSESSKQKCEAQVTQERRKYHLPQPEHGKFVVVGSVGDDDGDDGDGDYGDGDEDL